MKNISSFNLFNSTSYHHKSYQEFTSLSFVEGQHGAHLNQWRSGKQDLVALQQQAVPTNTWSDPIQNKKATASESTHDNRACVTARSPLPTVFAPYPTTTTHTSSKPLLVNSQSEMSDKIQISSKEPGVCVETGHGRSSDPSPRPPQKQYSNGSNVRKQQNRTKGNYGNSKGMFAGGAYVNLSSTS